jgi:hypothetical protein
MAILKLEALNAIPISMASVSVFSKRRNVSHGTNTCANSTLMARRLHALASIYMESLACGEAMNENGVPILEMVLKLIGYISRLTDT